MRRIGIVGRQSKKDVLVRQELGQQVLGGAIRLASRLEHRAAHRICEALGGRVFDGDLDRPVRPGPDHAGRGVDVDGLHPVREDGAAVPARIVGNGQRRGRGKTGHSGRQEERTPCQNIGNDRHDPPSNVANRKAIRDVHHRGITCQFRNGSIARRRRFGEGLVTGAARSMPPAPSSPAWHRSKAACRGRPCRRLPDRRRRRSSRCSPSASPPCRDRMRRPSR
ncbi:hypothetical protein C7449_103395 [Mycoplana dimorpha]|uniref:Uncharacterized protein n=1 Tax=Mycoplana dimorpha TaxID=28320 RepID=A0A2T5BBL1_MYCDI|nr:hypothetical protein C7449_103395 [Mycoplana dimorpha]